MVEEVERDRDIERETKKQRNKVSQNVLLYLTTCSQWYIYFYCGAGDHLTQGPVYSRKCFATVLHPPVRPHLIRSQNFPKIAPPSSGDEAFNTWCSWREISYQNYNNIYCPF
jgi:hypothetical protein